MVRPLPILFWIVIEIELELTTTLGFESTLQDPVAANQESLSPGHISIPSQGVSSGSGTSDFVVSSNADLLRGTDEDRLMSLQDYSFPRIFRQGREPADAHEWGGLDADHRNDTPEVTADSMRNIANDREPPIVWPPGFAETISRVGSRLRDRGETEPFSRPAVAPTTRSVHATPTRVLSAQLSGIYQQLGRVGASLQALQANHLGKEQLRALTFMFIFFDSIPSYCRVTTTQQ